MILDIYHDYSCMSLLGKLITVTLGRVSLLPEIIKKNKNK